MISITAIALLCLSLSTKTKFIKNSHNRHVDIWATNGSLWTSLRFASSEGKMPHRLLAQLSAFPRWQWVSFRLVTGCSTTRYLQGVQPARFLGRLCLLAVQGGQELPSHPETKEEVKGFVHCWENVLKCSQVLQQNITLIHPDLILPTEEWYRVVAAWGYGTVTVTSCQENCPLPSHEPQPTSVSTHTMSMCATSHNQAGTQPLQAF